MEIVFGWPGSGSWKYLLLHMWLCEMYPIEEKEKKETKKQIGKGIIVNWGWGLYLGSRDVRKAYQTGPDTLSVQGTQPLELRSERQRKSYCSRGKGENIPGREKSLCEALQSGKKHVHLVKWEIRGVAAMTAKERHAAEREEVDRGQIVADL